MKKQEQNIQYGIEVKNACMKYENTVPYMVKKKGKMKRNEEYIKIGYDFHAFVVFFQMDVINVNTKLFLLSTQFIPVCKNCCYTMNSQKWNLLALVKQQRAKIK